MSAPPPASPRLPQQLDRLEPLVCERLQRVELEEGPPLQVQVGEPLEGLWVQRRQEEAGAESERTRRRR